MSRRRTVYEIYWEVLIYCKTPRSFTAIITRCDLNSKTGQDYLEFLTGRGYLEILCDSDKISYRSTDRAAEYTSLFSSLYQKLFDAIPGFKL